MDVATSETWCMVSAAFDLRENTMHKIIIVTLFAAFTFVPAMAMPIVHSPVMQMANEVAPTQISGKRRKVVRQARQAKRAERQAMRKVKRTARKTERMAKRQTRLIERRDLRQAKKADHQAKRQARRSEHQAKRKARLAERHSKIGLRLNSI